MTFPIPPKLFFCEKCKVFFYSNSKMIKPTHPLCKGHQTRLADENEIKKIAKQNYDNYMSNVLLNESTLTDKRGH